VQCELVAESDNCQTCGCFPETREVVVAVSGKNTTIPCMGLSSNNSKQITESDIKNSTRWHWKGVRQTNRDTTIYILGVLYWNQTQCTQCSVDNYKSKKNSSLIDTFFKIAEVRPSHAGTYSCALSSNLAAKKESELVVLSKCFNFDDWFRRTKLKQNSLKFC
jgi:hypothetical protein